MTTNNGYKILKYEFKNILTFLYIITAVVLITTFVVIIGYEKVSGIQAVITMPIILGFLMVSVTCFYNQVTGERDQLLYMTPNSMYKVYGYKLLNAFIILMLCTLLINISNAATGYVPFMGFSFSPKDSLAMTEADKNMIRLYSMLWGSTIILALLAMINFVMTLNTSFLNINGVKTLIIVGGSILLLYGFIGFNVFMFKALPMKLIINNGTAFHFGKLAQSSGMSMSMSTMFSFNISDDIAAVFCYDRERVVLGITPIITNILTAAVFYPITAWLLKKKVFA